jgi:transcriptional regulator with XRE-family HTH domain
VADAGVPGLHRRVRRRRRQLGLTGSELAERAGISASYVSLIETGVRVPDEEVAAGIARALDDDEALYRAWARAARLGTHDLALLNELEQIARNPAYASLVESGEELPRLTAAAPGLREPEESASDDLARRLREVAFNVSPAPRGWKAVEAAPAAVGVPVLAPGEDPEALLRESHARDRLVLDRRLIGAHDENELFACEVTAAMTRLRGIAAPGDRIVFRAGARPGADRIAAVRTPAGLVLARALVKDASLLLLPGEGGSDFDTISLSRPSSLREVVAGVHVLLIRS